MTHDDSFEDFFAVSSQRPIERQNRRDKQRILQFMDRMHSPYEVAIITAIPDETEAVLQIFQNFTPLPYRRKNGLKFRELSVSVNDEEYTFIHVQCSQMGNNASSIATAVLLERYPNIKEIIMCGIAGGVPDPVYKDKGERTCGHPHHVRLGDLVVSDVPIIQYDHIKAEVSANTYRQIPNNVSPSLRGCIGEILLDEKLSNFDFASYCDDHDNFPKRPKTDDIYDYEIDDYGNVRHLDVLVSHPKKQPNRQKGRPLIHLGKIGSANILLKNPNIRDELRKKDQIRAIEMEGAGVSDAAWNFGANYLVVRGIVDYCDGKKNDIWRTYSAYTAAILTKKIIEKYFENN